MLKASADGRKDLPTSTASSAPASVKSSSAGDDGDGESEDETEEENVDEDEGTRGGTTLTALASHVGIAPEPSYHVIGVGRACGKRMRFQ